MENSKPIEDFENYLIFPDGRVFSLKRQIYLKPGIKSDGYYLVSLCKSGKVYQRTIARLVAQAFIPNPESKPQVNHKDGNKLNNNVSNLEWVTQSENNQHAYDIGLKKHSLNTGKTSKIPVNVYDYITGEFKSIQPSIREAARFYGLHQENIHGIFTGKQKQTGGLTFTKVFK